MSQPPDNQPPLDSLVVPAPLRSKSGWLGWRFEQIEGEPKPRKVPYYASGKRRKGRQGSAEDRASLTTFPTARDAAMRFGYDGIGFAPLPGFGVVALDFDDCVGPGGKLPPIVEKIAQQTYAEYSPSGKGIRVLFKGDVGNHKSHHTKNGERIHPFGFETFSTSGFVTLTGNVLPHVELLGMEDTIEFVTQEVTDLCQERFGNDTRTHDLGDENDPLATLKPKLNLSLQDMETALTFLDPDMGRDEWLRVGMALHHETDGDDTGFALWNDWSAGGGKYPDEERLRADWDSFDRPRSHLRTVTMATVLRMVKEARGSLSSPSDRVASAEDLMASAAPLTEGDDLPACTTESFTGKFPIKTAAEVMNEPPPDWIIQHVIPRADLGVMFGASGSGKSFVATDMAVAIATGMPWRGNRVERGRVLIIAAEGRGGVGKRIKAYSLHHNLDMTGVKIGVMGAAPNFLQKDDIGEVVDAVRDAGGYDVIFVDTFAKVTPGANENAGEDMGLALANAQVLHDVTGAMIMLIHHSGKDATKGSRGWSGIKAAADAEIEVLKEENGRKISISKMKDGDDGLAWGFKLEVVETGKDKYGDPVTSCVAIETDVPLPPAPEEKPRKGVKRLSFIETHILEMAKTTGDATNINKMKFVEMCVTALPLTEGQKDLRWGQINKAVEEMSKGKDAYFKITDNTVLHFINLGE